MAFSGGTGTVTDPYQVATAADLALINSYLDKAFIQIADIDLSDYGNWPGIGIFEPDAEFKGVYDGNGFAISGMVATATSTQIGGLFGFVVGATIKNTRLRAPEGIFEVYGSVNGLFVSEAYSSTFENCRVTGGQITQDKAGTSGAFAGIAWDCSITNCHATATISIAKFVNMYYPYMGGFVAYAGGEESLCVFDHCSANVVMSNISSFGLRGGGFAGQLEGSFLVQKCWSLGSMTSTEAIVSAAGFIGSIINDPYEATGAGLIKDCYTQTNITQESGSDLASTAAFIGKIDSDTGYSYKIDNCYAANRITINVE